MNAVQALAERAGLLTRYRPAVGETEVVATEAAMLRVLQALDFDVSSATDAEAVLADEARWRPPRLEPVAVVVAGRADAAVPTRGLGGGARAVLAGEDGAERTVLLEGDAARVGSLAPGYHTLTVRDGALEDRCTVLATPGRCPPIAGAGRAWGVFAPVYALRSPEADLGAGDLGDLARLIELVRERGGHSVGTLPILAADLEVLGQVSPYSAMTRLFWNELYIDHRELIASGDYPRAAAAAASAPAPAAADRVDYRAFSAAKQAIVAAAARDAWSDESRVTELRSFALTRPHLDHYCRFRDAIARTGTTWREWPPEQHRSQLDGGDASEHWRRHVFAQWIMDRQLARLRGGLYLDLPVGVSADSFDCWHFAPSFVDGISVGAPPDELFEGGQNWGLPPLHPERVRSDGYRYFAETLRAHMRHASMLRIDHVMGLHRLFWIPDDMSGAEGIYVKYRAPELYAVVAIEAARAGCAVVGEDLGTVPEDVRPAMRARGIYSLAVGLFMSETVHGRTRPSDPGPDAVASLDTHDTATFLRFAGEQLGGDPADLHREWLGQLASSGAAYVLATLGDLSGEVRSQNVPGTPAAGNWELRFDRSVAELFSDPGIRDALDDVERRREAASGNAD